MPRYERIKEVHEDETKKLKLCGWLCLAALLLSGCAAGVPGGTESPAPTVSPSASQPESSAPETAEHLRASADVDGDGGKETLVFGDIRKNGAAASLWVDGGKVLDLESEGAFDENTCRLTAADLDGDGRDEVLVLLSVPARQNGASFLCVELEDGVWQTKTAAWPSLALTLSDDWQCTLTDGTQSRTVTAEDPAVRESWFDEAGAPTAGSLEVAAFTEGAVHTVENGQIRFNAWVIARDRDDAGADRSALLETECTVTVTAGESGLTVDDALCQAVLDWLTQAD